MKILLVTKDLQNLRLFQMLIQLRDPDTVLFMEWKPAAAISVAQQQDIDICICELSGGEEYIAFLLELCKREKHPEIISILGNGDPDILSYLEDLPAVLFLRSPFDRARADQALAAAWRRVEMKRHIADLMCYQHYWESHKRLIRQQFWMRLCNGQLSSDPAKFMKEAEDCGVDMRLDDTYQAAVLSRKLIRVRNTEVEKQTRQILLEYADAWFCKRSADYVILDQLRPVLIVRNMPNEEFLSHCSSLVRSIQKERNLPLCIYYDADIYCEKLFSSVITIVAVEKEDMEEIPGVYPAVPLPVRRKNDLNVLLPPYTEDLLRNGNYSQVLENIHETLWRRMKNGEISSSYLKAMRLDIQQVIYCILNEKSIPAHKVMMTEELKELDINAHISVDSFIQWVEAVLARLPENRITASVTKTVQNYIKTHIREELSREEIASALYMNVDYLGRLYKLETGQPLAGYIRQEKMREACRMLVVSQKSISEIGTELGYGNFSHFSKLFKKVIGCTPKEYREKERAKAAEQSGSKKSQLHK